MATKAYKIKTTHLTVTPMTDEEMRTVIENETSEEKKTAYAAMLAGCTAHPNDRPWYALWKAYLKDSPDAVTGYVYFYGAPVNGTVRFGYDIFDEYRGHGYTVEAGTELINWAFLQKDVFAIDAFTSPEDEDTKRVYLHLKMEAEEVTEDEVRYRIMKPPAMWNLIWLMMGVSIGSMVGAALENFILGITLGLGVGFFIGTLFDKADINHRLRILGGK